MDASSSATTKDQLHNAAGGGRRADPADEPRRSRPVLWWAAFGAFWLTFMAFVLIRWISGPYFQRVPVGPSDPPMYMKVFLMTLQVTMIPAMACLCGGS